MKLKEMTLERAEEIEARLRRWKRDNKSSDLELVRTQQTSLISVALMQLMLVVCRGPRIFRDDSWWGLLLILGFLGIAGSCYFEATRLGRIRRLFEDRAPQDLSELRHIQDVRETS